MDFSIFFDKNYQGALSYLGKYDWLIYEPTADYNVSIRVNNSVTNSHSFRSGQSATFLDRVADCTHMAETDNIKGMWMLSVSKLLAYGPKIFQPTPEDCLASLNTKIGMRYEDYRQPYDAVIIKIPDSYQSQIRERYKISSAPKFVIPFYDIEKSFVCVSAFFDQKNIVCNLIPNRPEYDTIQDCLDFNRNRISYSGNIGQDPEIMAAEEVQRLAMNFCLLMTLRGIKNTGPLEPNKFIKAQQKLRKPKNRLEEIEARAYLTSSIQEVKLHQDIKVYATEVDGAVLNESEEGEAENSRKTGRLLPVHWRNGYHRMQPYGPRNAYRKRIYIKPVWVNLRRLGENAPDPGQTSVTYTLMGARK